MSFHHCMMLQRYGLGRPVDIYSQANGDPIFTPIFTAMLGTATIGASTITWASVAAALAAGGDYWEFSL